MLPAHFTPPEPLLPYVSFYSFIEADETFHEPYCSPPLGLAGLHFNFEGINNATLNGKLFLKDDFSASGQITAPMVGSITGRTRTFLVFMQPCGMYQLFGCNMSLLTNTSIALADFLGKERFNNLMAEMNAATSNEAIVSLTNKFLVAQQPVFELAPKFSETLDFIHTKKGIVSVKDVEHNCFITARSLERYFKLYIGLTPKEYIKIYRFKCLVNFINQNPGLTWDKLCEQNGFYDQSHLTRYFVRYLKTKPGDLVNLDMEFINFLLQ